MARLDWDKARRREATLRPAAGVPTTRARYPGTCILCAGGYQVGAKLGKVAEGWGHINCAQNATSAPRSEQLTRIPAQAETRRTIVQQYRKDRRRRNS